VSDDVQPLPSSQLVPLVSLAVQLSDASLQLSLQLGPVLCPAQGLPTCAEQVPPPQVSAPLQKTLSLHATVLLVPPQVPLVHWSLDVHTLLSLHPVPLGSGPKQLSLASLHDVEQLLSVVTSAGHGLPAWPVHAPLAHVSAPLQYSPSAHVVPFASFASQRSVASLQLSLQFGPVSCPAQGLPGCTEHVPPLHVSVPLQNSPSLQAAALFVPPQTPVVH